MFWLAKLKISLRTCFEFFYETSNFIFQVKASLHLIDHNLELMHTNTQEAEGDEKAEVQVSFSNIWHWNQSVFIHLTLGPISIHKCNGYKLGELPRQADGEQDQEACLLCLGGFPFSQMPLSKHFEGSQTQNCKAIHIYYRWTWTLGTTTWRTTRASRERTLTSSLPGGGSTATGEHQRDIKHHMWLSNK